MKKSFRGSNFVPSKNGVNILILFLAFQRIGVRHTLDQLLPISSLLMGVDPTDDDSGSHSLKENNKSNSKFVSDFCHKLQKMFVKN